MSRQRQINRAARLAEQQRHHAKRAARRVRAERRRAVLRRIAPHRPAGRTGRMFARRSAGQRILIAAAALGAVAAIWLYVDGTATRVALTALVAVAMPALVVLTFDRRI